MSDLLGIGDSDSSIPDSPIPSPVTYCGRVMAGFPRRPHAPGAARDWHERAVITAMRAGLVARQAGRESYRTDVNRNDLAKELLVMEPGRAEWLWMCDEDVIPPPPAIIHMVKRATEIGADVLVALVLTRDGRPIFFHEFTGFRPDDWGIEIPRFEAAFEFVADFLAKHEPKPPWSDSRIPAGEACIALAGCGTGCILVHRRVFEGMPGPWFIHWAGKIPGTEVYATGDGTEDLGFSYRATQLHGFKIYGDASIFCEHLDTIGMGSERFWTAWREIQLEEDALARSETGQSIEDALARSETGQSTSQTNLEEVQHGR
jgi:hypothetical protein